MLESMRRGVGAGQYQIRPFTPGDLDQIALRPDFALEWGVVGPAKAAALAAASWAFTLERGPNLGERQVLASAGVRLHCLGCWGAWCLASDLDVRGWAMVRRMSLALFTFLESEMGASHIEFWVRLDNAHGQEWARSMGFVETGLASSEVGPMRVMVRERD